LIIAGSLVAMYTVMGLIVWLQLKLG